MNFFSTFCKGIHFVRPCQICVKNLCKFCAKNLTEAMEAVRWLFVYPCVRIMRENYEKKNAKPHKICVRIVRKTCAIFVQNFVSNLQLDRLQLIVG